MDEGSSSDKNLINNRPWLDWYDLDVPKTLDYPAIPLFEILNQAAREVPDQIFTIYREQSLSYREISFYVQRLAFGLARSGLQKGEKVGLILPNCPEFVVSYFGVLMAGGVVVAMNPMATEFELQNMAVQASIGYLICALEQVEKAHHLTRVCPQKIISVLSPGKEFHPATGNLIPAKESVGRGWEGDRSSEIDFSQLLVKNPAFPITLPEIGPEDEAILQFTGGTTGVPKAAIGLHRNLLANTLQFRSWLSELKDGDEVVMAAIPLYHVYGMVVAMCVGLALKARLVLEPDGRNFERIVQSTATNRVTFFPAVPNMLSGIIPQLEKLNPKVGQSTIRVFISGSASLHPSIKIAVEKLTGGRVLEGYGLSEAPTATHCNPMLGENKVGSIGMPLPDVDCKIVDLDDPTAEVQRGEPGELFIKSPQVMSGYVGNLTETNLVLQNGWLATGDIARMDQDGYFYLIGRKKDLIKVGGFQVWPREVEDTIMELPQVEEVSVAGIESELGEIVKAWIVLKPAQEITSTDIQNWCKKRLSSYKIPNLVEFRPSLPKSNVGKILRRELIKQEKDSKHENKKGL